MKKIIECIPNFSEGKDLAKINQIANEIRSVDGVNLLDVDAGASTNRTVMTFVGEPEQVIEAAFLAIKKATEVIDMSKHQGTHPRMGATDVCPLVPISNISVEEAVEFAHILAKRVGEELQIPIYLYEHAAQTKKRKNLAVIRAGEYEGFQEKIKQAEWKPDYGPAVFNTKSGQTVIGVRDFLIAYNVNINSQSTRLANAIAFDVREIGRTKKDKITKKPIRDENKNFIRIPGKLKFVKGIGWFVDEYSIAQISYNLTNIQATPIHQVFEETVNSATSRGVRVTGSELIGLIPKNAMLESGKYFLKKQNRSVGIPEKDIILIAIKSLGLDELAEFDPNKKIIEYAIENNSKTNNLVDKTIVEFCNETSRESPAPGGGSVAAVCGALGASLFAMVANLSANKRGWEKDIEKFSGFALEAQEIKEKLLWLIDEDTNAFNKVMEAFRLPKKSEKDQKIRKEAIENANKYAAQIPFNVMQTAFEAYNGLKAMTEFGNPNSITDAGVGALAITTCVRSAAMNVKINLGSIEDKNFKQEMLKSTTDLVAKALEKEKEIVHLVEESFK